MISNTTSKVTYQGDGITTEFPYTFDLSSADDMHAVLYDIDAAITTELTSGYYVDTAAGKVIYPGYAAGQEPEESRRPPILGTNQKLTLYRATDVNQLTELGSKYPLPAIEAMSDKLTMICQEMSETLTRCVSAEIGSDVTASELLDDIYDAREQSAASASAAAKSAENAAEFAEQAGARIDEIAGFAKEAESSKNQAISYAALIMGRTAEIWRSDKNYNETSVVVYTDGYIYKCREYSPAGTIPAGSDLWVKVRVALDDFFILNDDGYFTLSETATFSNIFTFNNTGYVTLKEE